jgi:hypothetical protein
VAKSEELERENQQNGAACVQMAEGSSGGHEEKKKSKMGFKTAGNTVKVANKWSPKAVKNTKPKTALLKVLFFSLDQVYNLKKLHFGFRFSQMN